MFVLQSTVHRCIAFKIVLMCRLNQLLVKRRQQSKIATNGETVSAIIAISLF
jgi:hypothetical protein